MLTVDQINSNRNNIYPRIVKLTKNRGAVDLWGAYFWSVKDDFKISLSNWKGIRFIKDIIAYWDSRMLLTLIDRFPIITSKEIATYCILPRRKGEYRVNNLFYKEILDKYCAIVILINEKKDLETTIFPIRTSNGITIVKLEGDSIFKIEIEDLSKNTIRAPKVCAITIGILDFYEKMFFIKESGKLKIVFCTTDKDNVIERIKILSLKDLTYKITL